MTNSRDVVANTNKVVAEAKSKLVHIRGIGYPVLAELVESLCAEIERLEGDEWISVDVQPEQSCEALLYGESYNYPLPAIYIDGVWRYYNDNDFEAGAIVKSDFQYYLPYENVALPQRNQHEQS